MRVRFDVLDLVQRTMHSLSYPEPVLTQHEHKYGNEHLKSMQSEQTISHTQAKRASHMARDALGTVMIISSSGLGLFMAACCIRNQCQVRLEDTLDPPIRSVYEAATTKWQSMRGWRGKRSKRPRQLAASVSLG